MAETRAMQMLESHLCRDVFNAIPVGIAVENSEGQPLFVNSAFCLLLGLSEEDLRSKRCADFPPREDAEKDWALFQQLQASMDHYELERRYLRRDGSVLWGRLRVSLLTSHPSTLVLAMVEDITDKKKAEEELRSSEERLRLAAQVGRMYAYSWDVTTDEVVRSPEYVNVLGVSDQMRFTRQQLLEQLHPKDRARWIASAGELTPNNPNSQITYRVLRRDGSEIWLEKNARAFFDTNGRMLRVIGMVADVTERKLADEALSESEEKFRSVFRDAGVGMVIVSPEGRFLAANKAFCDVLGYTEDELLQKTVESVTYSEDWPPFSNMLQEALTERRGLQLFEKRCLHKSGRIVHTESSACLIRGREGEPRYFVGHVLDVTSRKESQEALSEMTRKMVEAQEHERARIARELHDDINQRLALLSVELEASKQNPPNSAADMSLVLAGIRQRLDEISSDVQSISHQLHSSPLEYLGIVAAAKSFCREFSAAQNVEIDFNHDDIPRSVPYDISLCLFRVLQEALHNAVKHSKVRHFDVRLSRSGDQLHLTVADCGVGFESGAALDKGGLGLTSMRERVRLVNGTISIESKPRSGTTIHVRVPLGSEQASQRVAV